MRILYLSKNIDNYKAANYQNEFLNALSKKVNLFIYGPGHSDFDKNKTIKQIINLYGPFNVIFIGHDGTKKHPRSRSGLAEILKKILFLIKSKFKPN